MECANCLATAANNATAVRATALVPRAQLTKHNQVAMIWRLAKITLVIMKIVEE